MDPSSQVITIVVKSHVHALTMPSIVRFLENQDWAESVTVGPPANTAVDEIVSTVRKKAEALQRVVDFAVAELSK